MKHTQTIDAWQPDEDEYDATALPRALYEARASGASDEDIERIVVHFEAKSNNLPPNIAATKNGGSPPMSGLPTKLDFEASSGKVADMKSTRIAGDTVHASAAKIDKAVRDRMARNGTTYRFEYEKLKREICFAD